MSFISTSSVPTPSPLPPRYPRTEPHPKRSGARRREPWRHRRSIWWRTGAELPSSSFIGAPPPKMLTAGHRRDRQGTKGRPLLQRRMTTYSLRHALKMMSRLSAVDALPLRPC